MSDKEDFPEDPCLETGSLKYASGSSSGFDNGYFLIQVLSCPHLSSVLRDKAECKLSKILDELS